MISPSNSSKKPSTSSSFCLLGVRKCRGAPRGIESTNRHTLFSWSPRVPFVRSRRHEAGRARDYPRGPHVSIGRAPSPPSSTFAARGAALHGQHPRFSFSMISPSNFVEERAPRLSAMGGRAGCNPDNPLELTTKCRLLAARGSKNAQFLAPRATSRHTHCVRITGSGRARIIIVRGR